MNKITPLLPPNTSDHFLQETARKQGLYVGRDKFQVWYLQLYPKPDDGTINPFFVLIDSRDDVREYLREGRTEHKTLGPREVFRLVFGDRD